MIIENGSLEVITESGGGIDPLTGYPKKPTKVYGEAIPCQIVETFSKYYIYNKGKDYTAKVEGEPVIKTSYCILIEEIDDFWADRIRLKNKKGNEIGEFSVLSMDVLDAVREIKIFV